MERIFHKEVLKMNNIIDYKEKMIIFTDKDYELIKQITPYISYISIYSMLYTMYIYYQKNKGDDKNENINI